MKEGEKRGMRSRKMKGEGGMREKSEYGEASLFLSYSTILVLSVDEAVIQKRDLSTHIEKGDKR